jgi:hypothetical protein
MLADDEDVGDYPVLGQTHGRTYAALVCAGHDGRMPFARVDASPTAGD